MHPKDKAQQPDDTVEKQIEKSNPDQANPDEEKTIIGTEEDAYANTEAHAVKELRHSHLAEFLAVSQIEELIGKGRLKTRSDLRFLSQEDLCHPTTSFLYPQVVPRMPAKRLLAAIPHYLGTGGFYVTEYRRFYEDGIPGYKAKECHRFYDQSSALSIHKPSDSVRSG